MTKEITMVARSSVSRLVSSVAFFAILAAGVVPTSTAGEAVSFKNDVYPILELRCLECHLPGQDGYEKSGFDLRSYEGLMKGTKHGPMVVPNSAFTSNLIAVIDRRTDRKIWMPHNKAKLSIRERDLIRDWINQGARND